MPLTIVLPGTGLRAGELRSLSRSSFTLDGEGPTVTIAAAYDKRRREDTLPLRPGTAALIKQHLGGKMPSAQAFHVPSRQHVAKMLRADLAEARRVRLESHKTPQEREKAEATTFLAYADGRAVWPISTRCDIVLFPLLWLAVFIRKPRSALPGIAQSG